MAKVGRKSKGKTINPTYFIFCEGESEEAYVEFIRTRYRFPVQIKSKISKNKINQAYVNRILKTVPTHPKDKRYLLYDLDVPEMMARLRQIRNVILLVSNPCLELWYVLHYVNYTTHSTSLQIIDQLEKRCCGYQKGVICNSLYETLATNENDAIERAKRLHHYNNPSTTVYLILEDIKEFQHVV